MLVQAVVVLMAQCILAFHLSADSKINWELKVALSQSIFLVTVIFGVMAHLASQISHKVGHKLLFFSEN